MPKGNTTINDILKKLYQAVELSWDANTNLYLALHTADPGAAGSQTTNEATYTSYARVSVARSTAGWTVASGVADNDASITAATDWLRSSTIINPGGGARSLVGVGRDSYRSPMPNVPYTQATLGLNVMPQRITGCRSFRTKKCGLRSCQLDSRFINNIANRFDKR